MSKVATVMKKLWAGREIRLTYWIDEEKHESRITLDELVDADASYRKRFGLSDNALLNLKAHWVQLREDGLLPEHHDNPRDIRVVADIVFFGEDFLFDANEWRAIRDAMRGNPEQRK